VSVRPQVLVVDDDAVNRKLLAVAFQAEGFEVIAVSDGEAALTQVAKALPALVLIDVRMPGMGGIETLRKLKAQAPFVPAIMLTSHGEIAEAVEAIKLGAYDFLVRPMENDKLVLAARRALERQQLEGEVRDLRRRLSAAGDLTRLMGPSAQVRRVVHQVEEVAPTPLTVVILGETGTGKELVARAIHYQSGRQQGPFIPLDCGALPDALMESELFGYEKGAFSGADRKHEGLVQAAEGGTLFLDEIANLTTATQAKLLRLLQERTVQPLGSSRGLPVDTRIIAATNEALQEKVAGGAFRQDLYYRLAEFTLLLPALRERSEDVVPLALRFLEEASLELRRPVAGISDEAKAVLTAHPWPGNVRQLRNVVRQAVLQSESIMVQAADVRRLLERSGLKPAGAAMGGTSLREISAAAIAEVEKQAIIEALRASHGNKSEAARMLKTDFKTLHLKMKRYGLQRD